MKKISFLILLVLLFTFFLISCDQNNKDNNPEIKFTISFDSNGGSEINSIVQIYGDLYELPIPERKGYIFDGWYYENKKLDSNGKWSIYKDVELTAKWIEIFKEKSTISFDSNGGNEIDSIIQIVGDEYELPIPVKQGYMFDGWYNGDIRLATSGVWTSKDNIKLVAKWIEVVSGNIVISFNSDGGNKIDNILQKVGESYSLPIPKRDGYTFDGWYINDNKIENTGDWTINNDVELIAKWTEIVVQKIIISFNSDGGNQIDSIEQIVGEAYDLKIPKKEGYAFDGWYIGDKKIVNKTTCDLTTDTELIAKWIKIVYYSISYDFNGGEGTGKDFPTVYSNITDNLTIGIPKKDGYKFIGWQTTDEVTFYYRINEGSHGDLSLKALWYETKYTYQDELGLQYLLKDDNTLSVVGYVGETGSIVIPYTYNDFTITEIGEYAFCGYGEKFAEMSISFFYGCYIPKTVTKISEGAFAGCDDLKPQLYKLSDTGKIKGAKEAEIEEWEKMLVIDDRNEHVVDTVKGLRPAIGWNKYWLP